LGTTSRGSRTRTVSSRISSTSWRESSRLELRPSSIVSSRNSSTRFTSAFRSLPPASSSCSYPPACRPDKDSRALAKSVTIPHVAFAAVAPGPVLTGRAGPRLHRLFGLGGLSLRGLGWTAAGPGFASSEFILEYILKYFAAPVSAAAHHLFNMPPAFPPDNPIFPRAP
jgi:hypothetical protein